MEDVTATELLAFLNITETDAALVDRCTLLIGGLNILQLFELKDELAPLYQGDTFVAKSAKVVCDFTQDVNWQSTTTYNREEKTRVDQKVARVKQEGHHIEGKLFLKPLLVAAQLKERDLVLEIRFDCFQK